MSNGGKCNEGTWCAYLPHLVHSMYPERLRIGSSWAKVRVYAPARLSSMSLRRDANFEGSRSQGERKAVMRQKFDLRQYASRGVRKRSTFRYKRAASLLRCSSSAVALQALDASHIPIYHIEGVL